MDVHCSSCGEPWDAYHLREDAVFDTDMSSAEATAWKSLPRSDQLSDDYRMQFRNVGWEFGRTVLNVIQCPACRPGTSCDPDRVQLKREIEEVLGDDEDGLLSTFDEFGL